MTTNNTFSFLIKYGELVLKKGNRATFTHNLYENIKRALLAFNVQVIAKYDHLIINDVQEKDFHSIKTILKEIPGITKFYLIDKYPRSNNLDDFLAYLVQQLQPLNFRSFRVSVNRHDKTFSLTSMEFAKKIGGYLLKHLNKELKVQLKNFEYEVYVEVHHDAFYVLSEQTSGIGGFPVNSTNRTLVLISGGIDSPVAAKLMLKKGFHVDFITFVSPPYTSQEAKQKTIDLAKRVTLNNALCNSKLYIINYTNIQNEISHISDQSYRINLMRRSFFRIAQQLGRYIRTYTLTTGESLGQVASQTLDSMRSISLSIDPSTLVFRPLLTYDKEEIIHWAIKYGTYDISIQPFADSCSIFAPKKPVTTPNVKKAIELEQELVILKDLETEATKIKNMEIIKLCSK